MSTIFWDSQEEGARQCYSHPVSLPGYSLKCLSQDQQLDCISKNTMVDMKVLQICIYYAPLLFYKQVQGMKTLMMVKRSCLYGIILSFKVHVEPG